MILEKSALRGRPVVAIALVLLAGIMAYANTLHAPFVLDDILSIVKNDLIRNLDNFFVNGTAHKYLPNRYVAYLSLALNYHFGGFDVYGYHLVNLVIHLATALLVYALLRMTFRTPYFLGQPGFSGCGKQEELSRPSVLNLQPSSMIPLFAALLFVVHPVQTQAVTYIVQRMASLATMLYLLSVVLYVQARLSMPDTGDHPRFSSPALLVYPLFAGSVLTAALAMKTKEITVTLPLAVLLYEVFFFRGAWRRRVLYVLPLLLTVFILPLSAMDNASSASDPLSDSGELLRAGSKLSRLDYLFTQFRVIVTYLRLLVFPVNQNLDYDYPLYTSFLTPPVFLSFLLLAAILALAVYLFRRSRLDSQEQFGGTDLAATGLFRLLAFGIFWFFLTLSVESSFIPIVDVIFEHRLYLPGFGWATFLATAYFLLAARVARPGLDKLLIPVAALLVLVLGFATYQRNHLWGDPILLWQDGVVKSPNKVRPHNNLGEALTNAGRYPEAIEVLSRAIALAPSHPHAYSNLGRAYILSDRSGDAVPVLKRAIGLDLNYDDAYVNLAAAYNQLRQFRETVTFLEQHLRFLDQRVEAHYHLGVAYAFLGKKEAARQQLAIVSRFDSLLAADLTQLLGPGKSPAISTGRE